MLTIASYAAGGANVLASLIARSNLTCQLLLQGPAVEIFRRRLGREPDASQVAKLPFLPSGFITGTGVEPYMELSVVNFAQVRRIHCVSFIDHWSNYRQRFEQEDGSFLFPDEIWVGDRHAFEIATQVFWEVPVVLKENPYFEDVDERAARSEPESHLPPRILYVAEPIDGKDGYDEWDALAYFLSNLRVLWPLGTKITIRSHPSESPQKYEEISRRHGLHVAEASHDLLDDIAEADVVVGCHTMALAVGLRMGRRAVSSIPPGFGKCSVPYVELEMLWKLVKEAEDRPAGVSG